MGKHAFTKSFLQRERMQKYGNDACLECSEFPNSFPSEKQGVEPTTKQVYFLYEDVREGREKPRRGFAGRRWRVWSMSSKAVGVC